MSRWAQGLAVEFLNNHDAKELALSLKVCHHSWGGTVAGVSSPLILGILVYGTLTFQSTEDGQRDVRKHMCIV